MSYVTSSGLHVSGAWTQAGFTSTVLVEGGGKKLTCLFDCGTLDIDSRVLKANHVFITHGHLDHCGAMFSHARSSWGRTKCIYWLPKACIDAFKTAKTAFEAMQGEIIMDLRVITPGEEIKLSNNYSVLCYETKHRVPSQGYCLIHTSSKLLEEYKDHSIEELKELRLNNVNITYETRNYELAYTGDTEFSALLRPENKFLFGCEILLTEATFLDGDNKKAVEYGHTHLKDFVEHAELFANKQLILLHISKRYKHDYIIQCLSSTLPPSLVEICAVNLTCQGNKDHITRLNDMQATRKQGIKNIPGWGWSGRSITKSNSGNHLDKMDNEYQNGNKRGRGGWRGGGRGRGNNRRVRSNSWNIDHRGNGHNTKNSNSKTHIRRKSNSNSSDKKLKDNDSSNVGGNDNGSNGLDRATTLPTTLTS